MARIITKKTFINYDGLEADFNVRPHTHDEIAIDTMFKINCYLPGEYDIKEGDLVIDIGGHIGIFSVMAALYGAKVLVYEPEKNNFEILQSNIKDYNNIQAFNSMVSEQTGETDFYLNGSNVAGHNAFGGDRKIKVHSTAFETILQNVNKVDLLKLDCEGSEYDILLSADLAKVQKIVMEYHGIGAALELGTYLIEEGFTITKFCGNKRLGIIQCKR